jgi:hypothetical protein
MHRLYVACLQVGMKAHFDTYFRNDTVAKLAGISNLEMNLLEAEVMRGLHWSVQVTRKQIDQLVRSPENAIASTVAACTFDASRAPRYRPNPSSQQASKQIRSEVVAGIQTSH